MSYTVTLWCGCTIYVSCKPRTGLAHARVVERRGQQCPVGRHDVGAKLWLWELLPDHPDEAREAMVESRDTGHGSIDRA